METALRDAARTGQLPDPFLLRFSNHHGLFGGGRTILVRGRSWERTDHAVRHQGGDDRTSAGELTDDDVRALLALLIDLAVWQPLPPMRPGVPDEGSDNLQVTAGDDTILHSRWQRDARQQEESERDVVGRVMRFLAERTAGPRRPLPSPPRRS
jgi:hypothetical protein